MNTTTTCPDDLTLHREPHTYIYKAEQCGQVLESGKSQTEAVTQQAVSELSSFLRFFMGPKLENLPGLSEICQTFLSCQTPLEQALSSPSWLSYLNDGRNVVQDSLCLSYLPDLEEELLQWQRSWHPDEDDEEDSSTLELDKARGCLRVHVVQAMIIMHEFLIPIYPGVNLSRTVMGIKLVDGVCWGCVFFFFLISTQSYQGIKLVDGVCWGCVFFFFLISTQSYQGIKLVDGVCWGCVFFFFLISTQSYQALNPLNKCLKGPAFNLNQRCRAPGNWADCAEDLRPGAGSPTAAAPSSNAGGARSSRRLQSSARSVPRAQEIPTTRARARQASSAEEHCVYLEHGPELQPFHYLRALDRLLGGTAGVIQISKVNGHQLLGLANRGLAERLINDGLEVEGTLLRAFPFRKRAERITVGNLPFFVEDSAIINALRPYGRITSIVPKMMKAGPYTYNDGRREAFIVLHEGVTTERLPTRLDITIKGEAWPAYLSSGIKCSRCHGQGHRRANFPLLAGRTTAPGPATPTSPTSVPPATAPRLPQLPSAQPPPPASPSPAMEVSDRLRLYPWRMSLLPPTPDIEMSIVEETSTSSTSSSRKSTREGLITFIERNPDVSFAGTDALGLEREEILDLLSSKTRARKQGPLLSPPQSEALAGLISQILDLRPGGTSNIYKALGQVRAELTTTPAAETTPPLPAPRPAGPTPPAPHGDTTTPAMATPPPPLSAQMERVLMDRRWKVAGDLIHELSREIDLEHTFQTQVDVDDIVKAILYPGDREPLLKRLPTRDRYILGGFISTAIWRARDSDPSGVKPVDGVCWGCVFFFFLISTQSYQGVKPVDGVCWGCVFFFFLISTQSYQGIKLVDGVCWRCVFFFFLISTQSYQGIKLVDGVCWGCVFFFFLISTQSYQGIKPVELVDGVCWGCVFFLISTQSYQGIKPVELVDGVCWG
ncbi:hypothetical protein LAZ67_6004019 [Cordylochernes scorpioides]|uniref:Uncharacterized protein n=1 Tax=Cordylochernes scorpioides TaxID=51811 RepID=A0ABY6KL58_9ARAC|nr:hypothetical protein LAZ67_6004019 [Cordylochernes scorpioides]